MVISALKSATPLSRDFPSGDPGRSVERAGLAGMVALAEAPHNVTFYFTKEHADAWLGA
jgi:hypothetical protein